MFERMKNAERFEDTEELAPPKTRMYVVFFNLLPRSQWLNKEDKATEILTLKVSSILAFFFFSNCWLAITDIAVFSNYATFTFSEKNPTYINLAIEIKHTSNH